MRIDSSISFIWASYQMPNSPYYMIYLWHGERLKENWSWLLLGVKGLILLFHLQFLWHHLWVAREQTMENCMWFVNNTYHNTRIPFHKKNSCMPITFCIDTPFPTPPHPTSPHPTPPYLGYQLTSNTSFHTGFKVLSLVFVWNVLAPTVCKCKRMLGVRKTMRS